MVKQQNPETERKRAWLNRYRESLNEQQRLFYTLKEIRSRSTSICVSLNPARSAPTGTHSDRVADSTQQIAEVERKLQAEQQRGQDIAAEIITAAFKMPSQYAQVLCCQYLDCLTADQTARKVGLCAATVLHYRSKALALLEVPYNTPESAKCVK